MVECLLAHLLCDATHFDRFVMCDDKAADDDDGRDGNRFLSTLLLMQIFII